MIEPGVIREELPSRGCARVGQRSWNASRRPSTPAWQVEFSRSRPWLGRLPRHGGTGRFKSGTMRDLSSRPGNCAGLAHPCVRLFLIGAIAPMPSISSNFTIHRVGSRGRGHDDRRSRHPPPHRPSPEYPLPPVAGRHGASSAPDKLRRHLDFGHTRCANSGCAGPVHAASGDHRGRCQSRSRYDQLRSGAQEHSRRGRLRPGQPGVAHRCQ